MSRRRPHIPVVLSRCADCGVGTDTIREYYMVHDRVWEQAWAGRRKPHHSKVPGQEILCIGCLEAPPRPQAHAQRLHQRTDQRSRPSSHVRALARTPDEEGASRVTLSG